MITGGWTDQGVRSGGKGIVELVRLTHENIDKEHICCAISNNKDVQVLSKKNWLKDRLDEGLVFLKGNVRGKCFIEYIPASYAWAPVIHADDLMYIDCLWAQQWSQALCSPRTRALMPAQAYTKLRPRAFQENLPLFMSIVVAET